MKVNFCWYTYESDGPILFYSVGSVLKVVPGAKCFVFEDGLKPIGEPYRSALQKMGVEFRKTWFLRRGNLNGIECVRGIFGGLQEASEGADWVAKIDSDCMLVKDNYLDKLLKTHSDKAQVGFGKHNAQFCWGPLYFLRKDIMLPCLIEMSRSGRMYYDPSGVFPEDQTVTGIIRHVSGINSVYVDTFNKHHDHIVFWDYESSLNQVSQETNLINFGYANPKTVPNFKEREVQLMKQVYEGG